MENNIPKTISFRADDVTAKKMEKIKSLVFEGREVSNSLILRTAVDFLHENYGRGLVDTDDMISTVKAYIKTTLLMREEFNYEEIESLISEISDVYENRYPNEVEEISKLFNYDDEPPITVAQLVRFKTRGLPETFLRIMGEDEDDYRDLSDDELADFLLAKFSEKEFKIKAKELFNIA